MSFARRDVGIIQKGRVSLDGPQKEEREQVQYFGMSIPQITHMVDALQCNAVRCNA